MRKLVFSDTEAFYQELKTTLERGDLVEVVTGYEHYSELPERLKKIFELHKNKSGTWVNVATGSFIAGAAAVTSIDYSALYVIASAGAGALFGVAVAGPVGAAIGGGLGALVGISAAAMLSGKHEVDIEVDTKGKLHLKVRPIVRN